MTTLVIKDQQSCNFSELEIGDKFYLRGSLTLYMKTVEVPRARVSFDNEYEVYNATDLVHGIFYTLTDSTIVIPVDVTIQTSYRFK